MPNPHPQNPSRRSILQSAAATASAVAAVTGLGIPAVHAAENNTLQLALIGCGGRGTGAAVNALSVKDQGPIKIVALADVFERKMRTAVRGLSRFKDQFDVPQDRQFMGFDAYKHAMDCLKPGDVAILATPPAFRWVMFKYAIAKGLNVFMEKPVTVDGPTTRRMFELADQASAKNLKVGVGLMIRHCRGRRELKKRIDDGQIGDLVLLRAYRMGAGGGFAGPKPPAMSDLMYQIQRFHSFLWASGGVFSDYNIHQIDECSWMKGAWPVKAHALGGRHYRGENVDQNFDLYSVEYTYPDGTKLIFEHRQMPGCYMEFASYAQGTKGSAIITTSSHVPGRVRTFNSHNQTKDTQTWAFPQPELNPYDLEWADLIEAIRKDQPYNEVRRGAEASLVTSMGRMAAHTGQIITYDQILNSDHEFAPNLDQLTADSPAPLLPNKDGKYPIPDPGITRTREF
jgi:predicted dehydrogenase